MAENAVAKSMSIGEVVQKHPETIPVFMQHGLHCLGCAIASFESIEQGAQAHGIDADALVKGLNDAIVSAKSK
jgi:hybrid cluster-associated redox disulfide protein